MSSDYLSGLVGKEVRVLRTAGSGTVAGELKSVEDRAIVVVYQVQERVPGGAPVATGRLINAEAFIPFETIDRVVPA